MLVIQIYIILD